MSFEVPGGNLNHCLDAGWPGGRPEGPQNPDDHPGWGLNLCCRGPNHQPPDHRRQIANSKMKYEGCKLSRRCKTIHRSCKLQTVLSSKPPQTGGPRGPADI